MRNGTYLFTSESVSEGHPDKVCDRISDAILDAFLTHDPNSRTAIETLATTNRVVLAGEMRGPKEVNAELLEEVVRHVGAPVRTEWEDLGRFGLPGIGREIGVVALR